MEITKRNNVAKLSKEFIAEFVGTAILMIFGISGVAQFVLSNGSLFGAATGFALGVVIAVFFAGPISGAHINPSVTLGFCVIGKCSWHKLPIYFVAQYFGALFGSVIVYILYFESIQAFEAKLPNSTGHPSLATAGIFITAPTEAITIVPAMLDQIVSTAILVFAILFIVDESCFRTQEAVKILSFGVLIFAFVAAFSFNCGAILNPARDLAPRVLLAMLGYGKIVFQAMNGNFWWAVGTIAPLIGGTVGALLYSLLARMRTSYVRCNTSDNH